MYFQFLIEDKSTEILVSHVMEKLKIHHNEKDIAWDTKAFGGIGNLPQKGKPLERKTGKLLNDLPGYMRAFDKILQVMGNAVLVIVLDNDKRDREQFRKELENICIYTGMPLLATTILLKNWKREFLNQTCNCVTILTQEY